MVVVKRLGWLGMVVVVVLAIVVALSFPFDPRSFDLLHGIWLGVFSTPFHIFFKF